MKLGRFRAWAESIKKAARERGQVAVHEVPLLVGEELHPNLCFQVLSWVARMAPEEFEYESGEGVLRFRGMKND